MRHQRLPLIASALILAGSLPAVAHHSFSNEYDSSKPVTLEGVVTRVEWQNPHVHFYVDVQQPDGSVVNWNCETRSPNRLERNGWNKDSMKPGDKVIVHGDQARDSSHGIDGRKVTLADGRKIFTGDAR
ncbi:MAG TPA: DUF6152 family protein [Bryobacteraceae bacterium]|nr:DUF6152 family protein [Bryobacteraceae bacterium]